jgi:cytochrome c55X
MKGGLGPALLPELLAERSDETLVEAIVDGRPGTAMPPWRFAMSEEEAGWLVRALREGIR